MGLFNKLKNALFEEDVEVPVETKEEKKIEQTQPVEEKKMIAPKEEKKEIKKPNVFLEDEHNERELFKAENTFKFPEFDEEEFKSSYKSPIEKNEKEDTFVTPKERFDRVKPVSYEFDKKPKPAPIRKEVKVEKVEEKPAKAFRPSPVISPVYGVLDKNYKKEDIVTIKKEEKPKKKFDIDAIRKKAFGTLEDDIEKTIDSPKESFYEKKAKNLLDDTADAYIDLKEDKNPKKIRKETIEDTIEMPKSSELRSNKRHREEEYEEQKEYAYPKEENVRPVKKEEKKFDEDTLENDLFDLIDSMYDNREDEE